LRESSHCTRVLDMRYGVCFFLAFLMLLLLFVMEVGLGAALRGSLWIGRMTWRKGKHGSTVLRMLTGTKYCSRYTSPYYVVSTISMPYNTIHITVTLPRYDKCGIIGRKSQWAKSEGHAVPRNHRDTPRPSLGEEPCPWSSSRKLAQSIECYTASWCLHGCKEADRFFRRVRRREDLHCRHNDSSCRQTPS